MRGMASRVLLVGESPPIFDDLAAGLARRGIEVARLQETAQAAIQASRFLPHLIVVDGGPKLLLALRSEPHTRTTPLIALGGEAMAARAAGAIDVLPVPAGDAEAERLLSLIQAFPFKPEPEAPTALLDAIGQALAEIDPVPIVVGSIATAPPKLLLVEDEPDVLELFAGIFSKGGYTVRSAIDGEEGWRVMLEFRPDLVVTDLQMPRLDGWGFLRRIRNDHRVGETPVLFLSARNEFRHAMGRLSAGAQDSLAKEEPKQILLDRVAGLLAPRRELENAFGGVGPSAPRGKLELVGLQWALQRVAAKLPAATVVVMEGWATYELSIAGGKLAGAWADLPGATLEGEEALDAAVGLRRGDLVVDTSRPPREGSPKGDLARLLEGACDRNNARETDAVDAGLVGGVALSVDAAIFSLYSRFGPADGKAMAEAIARGRTPRDLIGEGKSPLETEAVLRDLVRRRVIRVGRPPKT